MGRVLWIGFTLALLGSMGWERWTSRDQRMTPRGGTHVEGTVTTMDGGGPLPPPPKP